MKKCEMSARKKAWVKSPFSQLANIQRTPSEDFSPDASEVKKPRLSQQKEEEPEGKSDQNQSILTQTPSLTNSGSNWIESFAPTSIENLAVHAKKIAELQNWLKIAPKNPLCVLTGPSGAGKTASLRVLAAASGYRLQEWINPVDREVITTLGDQMTGNSYVGSQLDAFKSFLLRASRYKSLLESGSSKRLLLVEDFPNIFLSDVTAFESILEDYLNYGKSPLIFIVTDSKSRQLNIGYKLFSDSIKSKYRITHISFNAVATTLMQKAITRFCTLMRQNFTDTYKVPAQAVVDSIAISAQGDLRSALVNLHFASLKGAPCMLTKPLELDKGKSKKKSQTTLKSVGRDESVTMLHALGRVFNPKFTANRQFLHSPEEIAEAFSTEPKKFIEFVHANYLPHFREIEHVVAAADGLSQTDLILNEYREDALGLTALNVGIRSVMVSNAQPVSGWMPVHGPKRWKVETAQSQTEASQQFQLKANISKGLYATDYRTFVNCIAKKTQLSSV